MRAFFARISQRVARAPPDCQLPSFSCDVINLDEISKNTETQKSSFWDAQRRAQHEMPMFAGMGSRF